MLNKKFIKLCNSMLKEFKEKDGYVTCEFSTSEDNLAEKMKFLSEHTRHERYSWHVAYCSTCFGHNKDLPFHVELRRDYR